jgi:hypothetical protein
LGTHESRAELLGGTAYSLPALAFAMATEEVLVDRLGRTVLSFFATAGALAVFAGRAPVEAFRPPYEFAEILRHFASIRPSIDAANRDIRLRDRRRALNPHTRLA